LELLKSIQIKNPHIKINSDGCFLYEFEEHGFNEKDFSNWLDGKIMDIWDIPVGKLRTTKCPWCQKKFDNIEEHIAIHKKKPDDLVTLKLSAKAYTLLLSYIRNNNYDALAFLVNRKCQICDRKYTKDRKHKCQIAESSRNKMRSFRELTFKCDNFDLKDYTDTSIAIVYKRRPVK